MRRPRLKMLSAAFLSDVELIRASRCGGWCGLREPEMGAPGTLELVPCFHGGHLRAELMAQAGADRTSALQAAHASTAPTR